MYPSLALFFLVLSFSCDMHVMGKISEKLYMENFSNVAVKCQQESLRKILQEKLECMSKLSQTEVSIIQMLLSIILYCQYAEGVGK